MTEENVKLGLNFSISRFYSEIDRFFDEAVLKAKNLIAYEGYTKVEAKKEVMRQVFDSENEFNTIFNRQGKIIRPLALKTVDLPIRDWYDKHKEDIYSWILGPSHVHCRDCMKLSQMSPRTIDEWRDLGYGLPREGETACSFGCNCLLEKVESP